MAFPFLVIIYVEAAHRKAHYSHAPRGIGLARKELKVVVLLQVQSQELDTYGCGEPHWTLHDP